MKKLDIYILKKFLTTFVFVTILLVLVVSVIDYTEKNDKYVSNGLTALVVLKYYATFAPWVANLIMPINTFIAAILVTSGMAAKTEIIAILTSGVSFRRFLVPYLIGACMIAGLSYWLNGYVIPNGNKFRVGFEVKYLKRKFYFTDHDVHVKIRQNDYLYYKRYDLKAQTAYDLTLEHIEDNEVTQKLHAKSMKWDSAMMKWRIKDWWSREIDVMDEVLNSDETLDTALNITPKDFDDNRLLQETFTIPELTAHIDLLNLRGADNVRIFQIEYYLRHMQPFAIIILTFMAVIVAARKARQGVGFQIALGFFLAFIFIICYMFVTALAEKSNTNLVLAIWTPNILFSIITVIMYYTVPR